MFAVFAQDVFAEHLTVGFVNLKGLLDIDVIVPVAVSKSSLTGFVDHSSSECPPEAERSFY